MTAKRQWQLIAGVVAVLALGFWAVTRLVGDELFPVAVGSRAPGFTARTVTSVPQPRTLADYEGRVVLVNVWATWCTSCREEIPSLEALYRDYGPRGLKIVAVSIDAGDAAAPKVREFMRTFGVTFDVVQDPAGTIQQTYQVTGVPENFVIGADGVIRKKAYVQDWNSPENRALVARLLDEAATPVSSSATSSATAPANIPGLRVAFRSGPHAREGQAREGVDASTRGRIARR